MLDDMDLDRYDKVKCSKIEQMLPDARGTGQWHLLKLRV